jgi:hypothetical protein
MIGTVGCLTSKSRKDMKLISCGIKTSLMFVYLFIWTDGVNVVQAGLYGSN